MHCEKNLCENMMKFFFGTKDTITVREYIKDCGIQPHLWLQDVGGRIIKPIVSFVLLDEGKKRFLQIIFKLKTPFHFVLSLKKIITRMEIQGMKSHDYHVMMQEILPLGLHHLMAKECKMAIIWLSHVFKKLCLKVVGPMTMEDFKQDMAMTLVLLEQEHPPSFFHIMTHLVVHLVEELELCGLIHIRWMYPIEWYLKTLKQFVKNKARPKGSMAKDYASEEALRFCTKYLQDCTSTI